MSEIQSTLHVTDLAHMKNIIDVALSRGAFRGDELPIVSELYSKLSAFLESVAEAAELSEELADEESVSTEE
jgi:hypothetical protein